MKLSSRDRVLLGVVAALALCAAFYLFALKPERRQADHLQTQITAARATLATAQQNEAVGHAADVALRKTQADWTASQQAVPKVANIPGLLKLLQRSAAAAHVTMESISLAGSGSDSTDPTDVTTSQDGATTIPVSLTFNGGYQALNRLVEKLDSLVTVSNGRLRSRGPLVGISAVGVNPASTTSDPSALSVQLTATIYQHSAASTVLGNSSGSNG